MASLILQVSGLSLLFVDLLGWNIFLINTQKLGQRKVMKDTGGRDEELETIYQQ